MPTYLFKSPLGNEVELTMTVSEYSNAVKIIPGRRGQFIAHDGIMLQRVYTATGGHSTVWPKRSAAAGCAVDQIAEQEKYDREAGLNTAYDRRTGDAVFTSMEHQRRHLKHHGLVDNDSFI